MLVYAWALAKTAWVCDDAYITMRTVDNLVSGYGLTWNPAERVQVFTHPLWMLLLAGVYAFSRQAYLTLLAVSAVAALAAVFWLVFKVLRSDLDSGLALAMVCASMAFIEYSTSGLENPLTFLLLALVPSIYLRRELQFDARQVFYPSLLAAVTALNRLDLILFFIPALIEQLAGRWKVNKRRVGITALAGFLPLIAWELFSLFYYGALFPNTAYAKLNTGVPQDLLLAQGGKYFLDVLRWDPLTLVIAVVGAGIALWKGSRQERALALGILLYLFFIAWVGGDFMRGRFFAAPFLIGVILLIQKLKGWSPGKKWALLGVVSVFGFLSSILRPALMQSEPLIAKTSIADERGFYYKSTGWLTGTPFRTAPDHPWVHEGMQLRLAGTPLSIQETIGFHGYYAGPEVHILDQLALADPLLARLPIPNPQDWRIGHFKRQIPSGYFETLSSGQNRIADPALAAYYDHLSLITRGDLLGPKRIITILEMNLGLYDDWVELYVNRQFQP